MTSTSGTNFSFDYDIRSTRSQNRRQLTTPLNKEEYPVLEERKSEESYRCSFYNCFRYVGKILYWLLWLLSFLWVIKPVIKSSMFRQCKLACVRRDLLLFFYCVLLVLCGFVLVANQYIDTQHGSLPEHSINLTVLHTELYLTVLMFVSVSCIVIFWVFSKLEHKDCVTGNVGKEKDPLTVLSQFVLRCGRTCCSRAPYVAVENQNNTAAEAHHDHECDKHKCTHSEEHSIVYLMASVYVFSTGSFLLMVFEIIDFFHCGLHYSQENNQFASYRIHFAFYLVMLVFAAGQVFFLRKFLSNIQGQEMPGGHTEMKFLLVHLLATNVVLSCYFVTQDYGIFLGGSGKNKDTGGNLENLTCFGATKNKSDFVHQTLHEVKDYLEPFVIEYIIIVVGLLYSVLGHISKKKHQEKKKKCQSGNNPTLLQGPVRTSIQNEAIS